VAHNGSQAAAKLFAVTVTLSILSLWVQWRRLEGADFGAWYAHARRSKLLRGHRQRGSSLSITINVGDLAAGQVCFPASACLTAPIMACTFPKKKCLGFCNEEKIDKVQGLGT